jgi:Flp pilus assembly protein TadD
MSADNQAAAGAATTADEAARRPRGLEDLLAAGNAALAERRVSDAAMAFRKAVLLVPKDWRGY